jgi:polyhydroxybutyrate depolymerase
VGERSAWVHVPEDLPRDQKLPLVLMFHGGHSDGLSVVGFWREHFDRSYIIAFPNGQKADPEVSGWYPVSGDIREHVRFVEALVDELSESYPVDSRRIFAAGFSDGAQMTYRLACLSDRFQGFAIAAQTMKEDTLAACEPRRPAPMLFMLGTQDKRNPEQGREGGRPGQSRIGTEESISFWLERNRCEPDALQNRILPDSTPDGTTVRERLYSACAGAPVRVLEIVGGGHFWPSPTGRATPGRSSDISGAQEALDWWKSTEAP